MDRQRPGRHAVAGRPDGRLAPLFVVHLPGGAAFGHAARAGQVPPAGPGRHAASISAGWPAPGGWRRIWLRPPSAGRTCWPARSWSPEHCRPAFNWPHWAGSARRWTDDLAENRLAARASQPNEASRLAGSGSCGRWGRSRLALSVTQLSTLVDSAAGLAAHPADRRTGSDRLAAGRRGLSAAGRGHGGALLRRTVLSVAGRPVGRGGGDGHLSAAQPARRARRSARPWPAI